MSRYKKALFALAALLVVFFAAEIGLRLAFPDIADRVQVLQFGNPHRDQPETFVRAPVLFWRLRPNVSKWEINAAGFRGPLRQREKPAGVFRICCLGDSCTFGLGNPPVDYDETYPAVLERILAERAARPIEVLNFGCPGYSSYQGRRLLEQEVVRYEPDVVTAYFGLNDAMEAVGYPDALQRPAELSPALLGRVQRLFWRSAVYALLTRGLTGARRASAPEGLLRVDWNDFHHNAAAIAALAQKDGFRVLFLPSIHIDAHGDLATEAASDSVADVPLMAAFQSSGARPGDLIYPPPDSVHPTALGHRIIADTLAKAIAPIVESSIAP